MPRIMRKRLESSPRSQA